LAQCLRWATQPLDKNRFNIAPAITHNNQVRTHTDNRHGIEGYLDDAMVAKAIYDDMMPFCFKSSKLLNERLFTGRFSMGAIH
jgi:hypothetical protein